MRFRRACGQGAAALARRHGAGKIALALGLDSHKLKQISLGRWSGRKSKRARVVVKAVQDEPGETAVGADTQIIELKGSGWVRQVEMCRFTSLTLRWLTRVRRDERDPRLLASYRDVRARSVRVDQQRRARSR
jgi:hypothetical protein